MIKIPINPGVSYILKKQGSVFVNNYLVYFEIQNLYIHI